jgi:hypothetical protein
MGLALTEAIEAQIQKQVEFFLGDPERLRMLRQSLNLEADMECMLRGRRIGKLYEGTYQAVRKMTRLRAVG